MRCLARWDFYAHGVLRILDPGPQYDSRTRKSRAKLAGAQGSQRLGVFAQVGEWLKPADCKSAPPCEVRRFESFPVHQ